MISPYFDLPKRLGWLDYSNLIAIDIGCGKNESDIARQVLDMPFKKLVSIEAYKPYYEIIKEKKFAAIEHEARLMKVEDLVIDETFDIAFVFDLIEHLTRENGEILLDKLDRIAKKIIFFLPIEPDGFHRKNPDSHNLLQEHISYWREEDFLKRGYKTERIENCQSEYIEETDSYLHYPALWAIKTHEI